MPGSLKNVLDWLVSSLEVLGKPALLVSASPGGAAHAHAQLAEVLRTMNLPLVDGGAHVFTRARLDAAGEASDPQLLAALAAGLAALTVLVVRLRAADAPWRALLRVSSPRLKNIPKGARTPALRAEATSARSRGLPLTRSTP